MCLQMVDQIGQAVDLGGVGYRQHILHMFWNVCTGISQTRIGKLFEATSCKLCARRFPESQHTASSLSMPPKMSCSKLNAKVIPIHISTHIYIYAHYLYLCKQKKLIDESRGIIYLRSSRIDLLRKCWGSPGPLAGTYASKGCVGRRNTARIFCYEYAATTLQCSPSSPAHPSSTQLAHWNQIGSEQKRW